MSMYERTGWRDNERISQRHRMFGYNAPACDLDFPLIEYDKGQATALIEYKHERAAEVYLNNPSIRALSDLGSKAGIPAFVVRYKDDFSKYKVSAINDQGKEILQRDTKVMYEADYVRFLYRLRGYEAPEQLIENIKKTV